jgi:hypothetical protein
VDKVVTFEALCSVSANPHINLTDRSRKNANLPRNDRHIKSKASLCTDHRNGLVSVRYPREDGSAFIQYFIEGSPVCRWCLETGHRFAKCPNRASGKLAAKCGKCNKYPHPAAFCGIKTTPATPAPVAGETRTESAAVNSLGNWSTVNDVDENATESIHSVNLSCSFQPASVREHIGNYYSKIILDTGASLSAIKTNVAKGLFSE